MKPFQAPMHLFPGLEGWSKEVFLPSAGVRLHLLDTGDEGTPPVLLLHGLGDEADTWRSVLPLISATHRAIAPDLPGFGRSEKPNRKYTPAFFTAVVLELLEVLSLPRVTLVGHSNGAVIAQAFALEHPQRVEHLVLVGGAMLSKETPLNLGLLLFLVPGVGEWMYTRLRKDPRAAYETLRPYYHDLDSLSQSERDFLYQRVNERVWSDGQRLGFLSTLRSLAAWLPAQQKDLPDRLKGWQVPTTLIWGEDDRVNPPVNARALLDILPSARLVIVPRAGHNLQQEQPGTVAAAIAGSQ